MDALYNKYHGKDIGNDLAPFSMQIHPCSSSRPLPPAPQIPAQNFTLVYRKKLPQELRRHHSIRARTFPQVYARRSIGHCSSARPDTMNFLPRTIAQSAPASRACSSCLRALRQSAPRTQRQQLQSSAPRRYISNSSPKQANPSPHSPTPSQQQHLDRLKAYYKHKNYTGLYVLRNIQGNRGMGQDERRGSH